MKEIEEQAGESERRGRERETIEKEDKKDEEGKKEKSGMGFGPLMSPAGGNA